MKINIANIGNKEWLDFKADISFGLLHALRDLGHDVTMSVNQLEYKQLNIIIGADFFANNTETIDEIVRSNIEYVIYEVEKFDEFKINNRVNFNTEAYAKLTQAAKFIITPYLFNLKSYAKYYGRDKIRYARWGFHESMVNQNITRSDNFKFDGLFFGLLKGSRLEKIRALARNKSINLKLLGRDDPLLYKDYFISSCKWGLNLSYGDTEEFINPFRLYSMGSNGMPILADGGKDDDGYLSMCKIVEFSDFDLYLCQEIPDSPPTTERCRETKLSDNLKDVI